MLFGKAKVSEERPAAVHEDIGKFQITVQKMLLRHLDEPGHDILRQLQYLSLSKLAPLLEQPTEVTLVAELSDDIAMGGLTHHIIAAQDVGMSEAGECLDLAI